MTPKAIKFKVSPDEYKRIAAAAEFLGETIAGYVRSTLLSRGAKLGVATKEPKELIKLRKETLDVYERLLQMYGPKYFAANYQAQHNRLLSIKTVEELQTFIKEAPWVPRVDL